MSKTVICLIVLLALIFPGSAFCLHGNQLSGSWTVTWANDAKNQNEMSLTYKDDDGSFSGAYINDSKESCPVSGSFARPTSHLTLLAKWQYGDAGDEILEGKDPYQPLLVHDWDNRQATRGDLAEGAGESVILAGNFVSAVHDGLHVGVAFFPQGLKNFLPRNNPHHISTAHHGKIILQGVDGLAERVFERIGR